MSNPDFEIEKNIPIVSSRGSGRSKYPFNRMEVGDSFFVAVTSNAISGAVFQANLRHAPKHFVVRKVVENGVEGRRVWRIK